MQIYRNQLAQNIVYKANFLSDAKSIISKDKKTKEKKSEVKSQKSRRRTKSAFAFLSQGSCGNGPSEGCSALASAWVCA